MSSILSDCSLFPVFPIYGSNCVLMLSWIARNRTVFQLWNFLLMLNWIVWNRTTYTYKMDLALITYDGWCAIKPNQTKHIYYGLFVLILVVFFYVVSSFTTFRPNFTSGLLQVIFTATSDRNDESCNRIPSNLLPSIDVAYRTTFLTK